MTGEAMRMRMQLARLAQQHRLAPQAVMIPLSAPVDGPQILEGYASTIDVDLERTKFRPFAFCNPSLLLKGYKQPPLLYRHDESQPAGEIQSLAYDDRGNLKIRAHVTHAQAKRCDAFSIRAHINAFELHDTDSPNFFGLVTSAEIIEISLTDTPANPRALVQHRYRPSPAVECYDIAKRGVVCISRIIELMAKAPPATPPPALQPRSAPAHVIARKPTQFARLVGEMNRNEQRQRSACP